MVIYVFKNYKKLKNCSSMMFFENKNPNLLKFRNNMQGGTLREEDMVNLFMGFIKLIKKSIRAELEFEYKKKLGYYHLKIQKLLSKIR